MYESDREYDSNNESRLIRARFLSLLYRAIKRLQLLSNKQKNVH